jgi:hypothetical protein
MAVYHHPCGKREVCGPGQAKQPCAACDHLFARVEASFLTRVGAGR